MPRKQSRAAANKTGKRKNTGALQEDPTESDPKPPKTPFIETEEFNITSEDLPPTADLQLKNYLERNELLQTNFTVNVYKFDTEAGNSQKTFCKTYACECPSEHQIGLEYGGGRYLFILQTIDSKGERRGTTHQFKIHKNYDKLSQANNGLAGMPPIMFGGSNSGGNDMMNAINLMKTMMGMFFPLIQQMSKPAAVQETPEIYGKMMVENMKLMNDAQKEIFKDNSQFWNDVTRESRGLSEVTEGEGETTGIMGTINAFMPFFEKLLPLFVGTPTPQTKTAVDMVKSIPEYKNIIKDKKTIKRLLKYITEKHGKETARQVLKEFGIKTPK